MNELSHRSLPLRVAIEPGEALDGWLLRLARRYQIPAMSLLGALGLAELVRSNSCRALVGGLSASQLRRLEQQAGLAARSLDTAVLDHYRPTGWPLLPGSRFCVDCLREPAVRWPIRWQLPYTFACLDHDSLLIGYCPSCRRAPHSRWSKHTAVLDTHRCCLPNPATRQVCGNDLREAQPYRLDRRDPRLATQRWINERLDTVGDADIAGQLRDVHAVTQWARRRLARAGLSGFDAATIAAATQYRQRQRRNLDRRQHALETAVTAVVTTQAVELLTSSTPDEMFARFRPLVSSTAADDCSPLEVADAKLAALTPALTRRLLAACDPHLAHTDRLRHRTTTGTPRLADQQSGHVAAQRARHVPEYLWPEWIIRLRPLAGAFADTVAIDGPVALLLPGNTRTRRNAAVELTGAHGTGGGALSWLVTRYPAILPALAALADHLDTHGSPIDYRRRRALFTDVAMDWRKWEEICYVADAHPGLTTRYLNARRYLFALLTGANLANPRHALALSSTSDNHDYLTLFHRELTSPLRKALHEYGRTLLRCERIDEPLTWAPPGDCVTGLNLPGREPDDIDLTALDQLINQQDLTITAAAQQLGVTTEHVRYALSQLHSPVGRREDHPAANRR